jgi:ParB family chromosome partitioning protein
MADVGVATEPDPSMTFRARPDSVVPIEEISANPDQPRRRFAEEGLDELAASIREKGVLQPLIVRHDPSGRTRFQIVAGERRWRAAQRAQLHELPIIVRDLSDTEVLEIAIIENIQRADLNPIEEAAGYKQLMDRFGHTQERMAEALGKSRSHIANLLRLLSLPGSVQEMVSDGQLSAGHARALIPTGQAEELARKIVAKGLSVRETERMVKALSAPTPSTQVRMPVAPEKDADTRVLEGDLSAALGMEVVIDHKSDGQGGRLSISYRTLEQLDDLCAVLSTPRGAGSL